MEALFWGSLAFIAYVYVGYPALLALWAWMRPAGTGPASATSALPRVSVIVAARNEGRRLTARIDNLLACDYPANRLQIIVASDGSTDGTAAVLEPFGSRVELLDLPARGKPAALNAAVARARHEILVFTDARQRFARDAIRRLVSHFRDARIGAVSGELVLDCEDHPPLGRGAALQSTIAPGVGAYWRYEKWLRRREAALGSCLGVTGAIYAMRRWLWQPLPADTLLDDVLAPLGLVLRGYRVTFDQGARAYDEAATDAHAELRRKVRTLAGNFQLIAQEPRLLLPFVNPVWLQFVSHKLGRLLVPYALLAILVSSAWLAPVSTLHATAFGGQLMFYGLAMYGAVLDRRARMSRARDAHEAAREAA
jgi:cellulose synthase/poly-beta-1,6-N-acetylglucosamine synthase-like glycosyltransferase